METQDVYLDLTVANRKEREFVSSDISLSTMQVPGI